MASHIPPSIDPVAADRWAKSIGVGSPPWLHEEVARRMEERLQWIVRKPGSWLDWEPSRGGYLGHERVRRRYPDALVAVWEPIDHRVNASKSALTPAWWRFASRKRAPIFGLPAAPVDMVWANMALHMSADPRSLIGRWYDALADDGYLMFSCLGPDTLAELRRAYAQTAWPAPHHEFTDMHDWGDMLVQAGFAEPVMDMERVTLSYSSADALIAELRTLGRNLSANRFQGLRARNWRHELAERLTAQLARDKDAGRLMLTFEVVYGHAFKPRPRLPLSSKTVVSLKEMKSTLKIGRRPSMQSK